MAASRPPRGGLTAGLLYTAAEVVQLQRHDGGTCRSGGDAAMLRQRRSCAARASLDDGTAATPRRVIAASRAAAHRLMPRCRVQEDETHRLGSERYAAAAAAFAEYCRLFAQAAECLEVRTCARGALQLQGLPGAPVLPFVSFAAVQRCSMPAVVPAAQRLCC